LKLLTDQGYRLADKISDLTPLQVEFLVTARELEDIERQKFAALKALGKDF
jgi:hypothetical protein